MPDPLKQVRKTPKAVNTPIKRILSCLKIEHVPSSITCRDKEVKQVQTALLNSINNPGGEGHILYLYGQPGTGKSATVKEVVRKIQKSQRGLRFHDVNVLSLTSQASIFQALAAELLGKKMSISASFTLLDETFRSIGLSEHHVILLDEFDNAMSNRGNENGDTFNNRLYSLFDWPTLCNSKLTLICVANTLCLPQHLMPRCFSRLGFGHINFPTYTHDALQEILLHRFKEADADPSHYFDKRVLEMLCRKIASLSGDVRMALRLCHSLVELRHQRRKPIAMSVVTDACQQLFNSAVSEFAENLPLHTQVVLFSLAQLHMRRTIPDEYLGFAIAAPELMDSYRHHISSIALEIDSSAHIELDASETFGLALDELVDAGVVQVATYLQMCAVPSKNRKMTKRCHPTVIQPWGQTAISLQSPVAEIMHGIRRSALQFRCVQRLIDDGV